MCPPLDFADRESIKLRPFVESLLADFDKRAQARHVTLDALVFSDVLEADVGLLRRLLARLVGDAVSRAPAGTSVSLVVSPRDQYTEFRVADERAGNAWEKVCAGDARGLGGDGLRLTFCRVAAEAHGGRLSVAESDAGTVVCLAFPSQVRTSAATQSGVDVPATSEVTESERSLARRESGIYAQAEELPSTAAARTVLVVDDEELVRTFIARALKKKGNVVVEADCAERAVDILQAHQQSISLLLSDVGLPGLSGAELVRHASLLIPGLPTLLMSATPKEALVCAGLIATDTYLLEKPFAIADLLAKVEELLNSRSYPMQRRSLRSG